MTAKMLTTRAVAKPWGRTQLWPGFEEFEGSQPVGEIWFENEHEQNSDLLVKYLFTSEKLSIQVHPNDEQARASGYPRGKDEAWLILGAEPDSTIALGPKKPLAKDLFGAAIEDGSIADLLDWRPVQAGDFIYSPAGTVHAIGAGLTLIEVQQNLDLTYRLFDYGRPRELHIDEGVAVSTCEPFVPLPAPTEPQLLTAGPKFTVERITASRRLRLGDATALFIPVRGTGMVDGHTFRGGECWQLSGSVDITCEQACEALLAYSGSRRF